MTQPRINEEVLSIDLGDFDDLYRVRRGKRILYLSIRAPSVIPYEDRTESGKILSHLRKLPKWDQDWQTLTVAKLGNETHCYENLFSPHRLRESELLVPSDKRFDIADLQFVDRVSDRVSLVSHNNIPSCVKIAKFSHELTYVKQEIWAYSVLIKCGLDNIAPRFYGYVYEDRPDRIVGFLMERLFGRYAVIADLKPCRHIVQQMHSVGLAHGDLNRYNFIVTSDGAKLVDFEASTFADEEARAQELKDLTGQLASTSPKGRYGT